MVPFHPILFGEKKNILFWLLTSRHWGSIVSPFNLLQDSLFSCSWIFRHGLGVTILYHQLNSKPYPLVFLHKNIQGITVKDEDIWQLYQEFEKKQRRAGGSREIRILGPSVTSLLEDGANLGQQNPSPDLIHSVPQYEQPAVVITGVSWIHWYKNTLKKLHACGPTVSSGSLFNCRVLFFKYLHSVWEL